MKEQNKPTGVYCTLFDKNYLLRGLALHRSMIDQMGDFVLWILCMDDYCYEVLARLGLKNVSLVKLSDIEDEQVLVAKRNRTQIEYCWTLSSVLPLYVLKKTGSELVTYLDADLFFYSPPGKIYEEFGNRSVMIIPHRFTAKNIWQEKTSGIYNVGMIIFRNDANGLECLNWWRQKCLDWCYDRLEDGKYGDQLYLSDWPTRFDGVCVLENHGANVASWNITRYKFFNKNNEIWMFEKGTKKEFPLIFYHFHGLKLYLDRSGHTKPYLATVYQTEIYKRYIRVLDDLHRQVLKQIGVSGWNYGYNKYPGFLRSVKQYLESLLRLV